MTTTIEAMVCMHCAEPIRLYDLAYFHAFDDKYWYIHTDGWFGCSARGQIGNHAEPEFDPYLLGVDGHRLDLAWTRLRLSIWEPLSRGMSRLLNFFSRISPDVQMEERDVHPEH